MTAYCGIDWAEAHHDLALVDEGGTMLAKRRISDDLAGFEELLQVLAEHGDCAEDQIPVAIKTGRDVVVINPMAAARYRERTAVTRTKSDAADALMLANVLRTDRHAHRPLPKDSELVRSVAVLARAGQDAVWQRQQATNQLRSLLREYFPAALTAFQVKHCCAPGSVQALIPGRMRGYGSTEEVQRGVAGAGHADGVGGDR